MKKLLITSFVAMFALGFLGVSTAFASSNFNQPSTFNLKVGSEAYISNYQNMKIALKEIKSLTTAGGCGPNADSRCLGGPSQVINQAVLEISTEGGCGPNADSRCLGAPAYMNTFNLSLNGEVKALALRVKAIEITSEGATLKVYVSDDNDGDDNEIHPMPPVPPTDVKEIPIGKDFGNRTGGGSGEVNVGVGGAGYIQGSAIVYPVNTITICPMGKEDCTVCSKGECKEKTIPYTEGTATAPGIRKMILPEGSQIQSVDKDSESTSTPAYRVKALRKARLFFLFPVNAEINYSVDAKTGSSTEVSRPWWNFLAW